eukprot:3237151-Alexandrium_andersonii.AAC.1
MIRVRESSERQKEGSAQRGTGGTKDTNPSTGTAGKQGNPPRSFVPLRGLRRRAALPPGGCFYSGSGGK